MNQTAKRNNNNKIKNNKELVFQSCSFTVRFTQARFRQDQLPHI